MNRFCLVGTIMLVLSGCASTQAVMPDSGSKNDNNRIDSVSEFKRMSVEMVHEMRLWAKAKESQSRDVLTDKQVQQRFFQSTHVPEGFAKSVTFKYYGPAMKAMEAVAMSAGYKFEVVNNSVGGGDPIVDINLHDQRLVEALREIGVATGDSVSINVIEAASASEERKIVYRYN